MPRKVKQTQKQKQKQTVIVNITQPKEKKAKPRKKRAPKRIVEMYREFPSTVYLPQRLSTYGDMRDPTEKPAETPARSIAKETQTPQIPPIFEDTGIVGTEGRGVEILDVPTKKETLAELMTPVALPVEDSGRAIARSEPEKRMTMPDDSVSRLVPSIKSQGTSSFGFGDFRPTVFSDLETPSKSSSSKSSSSKSYMSDVTMDSGFDFPYSKPANNSIVSDFSFKGREPPSTLSSFTLGLSSDTPSTKKESRSEKSFRFPEPTTFKYSDVERIGPSPYASERSFGEMGFSGSDSEEPNVLTRNVFMEQQADFMKKAKKQYNQPSVVSNESFGVKPKKGRVKPIRITQAAQPELVFGLPASTDFTGTIPKQVFKETAPYKAPSKMNKTELENAYKRLRGDAPPKMSKRDLYREVMALVSR